MAAIRLKKETTYSVNEGLNIIKLRILFGLYQRDLARLMRISQTTLSRMENAFKLKENQKVRVATAMGIKKEALEMSEEDFKGLFIERVVGAEGENNVVNIAKDQTNNIHPVDKVSELYEKLLQKEQEISELRVQVARQEGGKK